MHACLPKRTSVGSYSKPLCKIVSLKLAFSALKPQENPEKSEREPVWLSKNPWPCCTRVEALVELKRRQFQAVFANRILQTFELRVLPNLTEM